MFRPKSHYKVAQKNNICTPFIRNWNLQTSHSLLWRLCMLHEQDSFGNTDCTAMFIGKDKVNPRTGHEGPEGEYRYSTIFPLTSPHLAALPAGRTRYPLYRRLGEPQGRSGHVQKISPPPGFDPRTAQSVASRYTDWSIPAHNYV
jgi:hypothetical protein